MNSPENLPYNIHDELSQFSINELIDTFNKEVGNPVKGKRSHLLWAIHHEFIERDIDFTAIGNEKFISLRHQIRYLPVKNKLVIIR